MAFFAGGGVTNIKYAQWWCSRSNLTGDARRRSVRCHVASVTGSRYWSDAFHRWLLVSSCGGHARCSFKSAAFQYQPHPIHRASSCDPRCPGVRECSARSG